MRRTYFLLASLLMFSFGIGPDASAPQLSSTPVGPIWEFDRVPLGINAGEGAALSPDGRTIVFMGEPEGPGRYASLLLVELETGKKTVLRPSDDSLMPSRPAFSPDGKAVVFAVHGPTMSYPSDIYTVATDGSGLRKLTDSAPCVDKPSQADPGGYNSCRYYQRYYFSPRFSPDGSRILLFVDDAAEGKELTVVMEAAGGNLEIAAEGRPLCWSADGKAVYYTHKGLPMRMGVESRATQTVPLPALEHRAPLGRMAGRDWLAFRLDNGRIGWYNVESGKAAPEFLGEWSVPGVKLAGTEQLTLKGFDWSRSNEVLLWYQGEHTERFEVVRIFDPTAIR